MVEHGCEKKRDGKDQLGEEMLGKGRESQRNAEQWISYERCRDAWQRKSNVKRSKDTQRIGADGNGRAKLSKGIDLSRCAKLSKGIGVNSIALACDGNALGCVDKRRKSSARCGRAKTVNVD